MKTPLVHGVNTRPIFLDMEPSIALLSRLLAFETRSPIRQQSLLFE